MTVYYNDNDLNYRSFHEMLSTANILGMMALHQHTKEDIIFVKVSIFWDEPICFFVTYDGNITNECADHGMSHLEYFNICQQEREDVFYLIEIILHLKLSQTLFKKIALIAYHRYIVGKVNTQDDAMTFYKKLAYSNIKCVRLCNNEIINNTPEYYLVRLNIYWKRKISSMYMIFDDQGVSARNLFEIYDLSKAYHSEIKKNKKSELFLSDVLSTNKIEQLLCQIHGIIYKKNELLLT